MNVVHSEPSDFKKPLTSYKITVALKGIDDWVRSNLPLPNYLYGVKGGITSMLMTDEPASISFSDGSTIGVTSVAEVMSHMSPDVIEISVGNRVIVKDDYATLTDVLPPNIFSLLLMSTLLMFNTLDNSADRRIYFMSGGYTDDVYPPQLEHIASIEELLGIGLVDIVNRYSNHTSFDTDDKINHRLKNHSNYNMLRYHVQTVMAEIRAVEIGIDVPDTMWELMIEDGQLYICYMGNPHMYRLLASKYSLAREEDNDTVNKNPNPLGLPYV